MNKKILFAVAVVALVQLACGPQIEVVNNTPDIVRLSVTFANRKFTISPEPGSTHMIDAVPGQYTAVVVPAAIWIDFAKSEEKAISQLLTNPESMTPEQIQQVADRMKKISENEQQLFKNAPDQATCANSTSDKENGRIEISGSADSNLSLYCTRVASSTAEPGSN